MRTICCMLIMLFLLHDFPVWGQVPVFEKTYTLGDSLSGYIPYRPKTETLKNGNTAVLANGFNFQDSVSAIDSSILYIKLFDENAELLRDTVLVLDQFLLLDMTATSNNGFAICGRTDSATVLITFDENGVPAEPVVIEGIGRSEIVQDMIEDNGKYYLFSADHAFRKYEYHEPTYFPLPIAYQYYFFQTGLFLNKVEPNGQVSWRSFIDSSATSYSYGSLFLDSTPIIDTAYFFSVYDLFQQLSWGRYPFEQEGDYYNILRMHPAKNLVTLFTLSSELRTDNYNWNYVNILEQKYYGLDIVSGVIQKESIIRENPTMEDYPTWMYYINPLDSLLLMRINGYYTEGSDSLIAPNYWFNYDGEFIDSIVIVYPDVSQISPESYFNSGVPFIQNRSGDLTGVEANMYYYDPDQDVPLNRPRLFVNTFNDRLELKHQYWAFQQLEFYQFRSLAQTSDGNYLFLGQQNDPSTPIIQLLFVKIRASQNNITVTTYIDNNDNGTYDSGDSYFSTGKLEVRSGDNTIQIPIRTNGRTMINVDSGAHTIRLISNFQRLNAYTIVPDSITVSFNGHNQSDSVAIRLVPKAPFHDLQVSTIPNQRAPRPGFASNYTVRTANYGTQTEYNIRTVFLKDARQSYDPVTLSGNVFSGDSIIWMADSLMPFGSISYPVGLVNDIPPALDLGDTTRLLAKIAGEAPDAFPNDNEFYLYEAVANSFDPNDKLEAHGNHLTHEQLQAGEYLYYTIRFQNTGNDYANRVVVTDTLSDNLDHATLQMIASSHPYYQLTVKDKRILTWTFNDIYLPDSTTNEPGSHGFITFRIKPQAGLTVNDVISNQAYIYFDFNLPIVTNTVMTSIIDERVTVVRDNEIRTVRLYPSPTSGTFLLEANILNTGHYTFNITSVSGQVLLEETGEVGPGLFRKQFSVDGLPNGLYLVTLQATSGTVYQGKIIKQ